LRPFGSDRFKPLDFLGRFLHYSRAEKRGITIVLLFILALWFLPEAYLSLFPEKAFQLTIQPLEDAEIVGGGHTPYAEVFSGPAVVHEFDPNRIGAEKLISFGMPPSIARRMQHYREKGGRFRKPEDLLRIWGMDTALFESLKPFIRIPEQSSKTFHSRPSQTTLHQTEKTTEVVRLLDVNTADSMALVALPGIGAKLAARILAYRERLGGFAHWDQLSEVYGLPKETILRLRAEGRLGLKSGVYRKVLVNTFRAADLRHPYITKTQALALEAYRQQHGPFTDSSDMRRVLSFSTANMNRLLPYLDFRRH
jgi:DNA uptake protein ComE-like DNA-binding protein